MLNRIFLACRAPRFYNFMPSRLKRPFLQIQDVPFSEDGVNVPEYLRTDSVFHGGIDRQYEFANDKDAKLKLGVWAARRWDSAVAERVAKLLAAPHSGRVRRTH